MSQSSLRVLMFRTEAAQNCCSPWPGKMMAPRAVKFLGRQKTEPSSGQRVARDHRSAVRIDRLCSLTFWACAGAHRLERSGTRRSVSIATLTRDQVERRDRLIGPQVAMAWVLIRSHSFFQKRSPARCAMRTKCAVGSPSINPLRKNWQPLWRSCLLAYCCTIGRFHRRSHRIDCNTAKT